MQQIHPGTAASGRAGQTIPSCKRPWSLSSRICAAHVIRIPQPHAAAAAQVHLSVLHSQLNIVSGPRLRVRSGSSSSAATTATTSGPGAAAHEEGAPSGNPGSSAADQLQWEAEIEETLKLVRLLPPHVRVQLEAHPQLGSLLEVVMDLGRPPLARFPGGDDRLGEGVITGEDLEYAVGQVGAFGGDNRAGIDATLHRISAMRNRAGRVVGLTCRVGRAVAGSADLVRDLVMGGASCLFLGRPGVGKTTAIRELSRLLADDCAKRVVIVDTSNEIGGDGDVPHAGIGRARRMQVPDPEQQHRVMIEAVENHMPEVVVIDEIGTEAECSAARTIAQRGVQLIATAHGNELENVVKNPSLNDLVGGIQSVTLGDEEARRRGVQKSVLERGAPPTFDVAVEMLERGRWLVHADVGGAVDALLAGNSPGGQVREKASDGTVVRYNFNPAIPGRPGDAAKVLPSSSSRQGSGVGALPGRRNGSPSSSRNGEPAAAAGSSSGATSSQTGTSAARHVIFSSMGGSIDSDYGGEGEEGEVGAAETMLLARPQRSGSSFRRPAQPVPGREEPLAPGVVGRSLLRRGRQVRLGRESPAGAVLRLHCWELEAERLWEVMAAMALHDKVYLSPRPEEADAVLALRSKLKGNAGLRGAARDAGVPIYAIKSSSSANLVRAFRTLLGQDPVAGGDYLTAASAALAAAAAGAGGGTRGEAAGGQDSSSGADSAGDEGSEDEQQQQQQQQQQQWDGAAAQAATGRIPTGQHGSGEAGEALEEAQLALESLVLPLGQPVELLPRGEVVRQQQAALAGRYGCSVEAVGGGEDTRLRLLPPRWPGGSSSSSGGGGSAAESKAGSSADNGMGAAVATSAVEG